MRRVWSTRRPVYRVAVQLLLGPNAFGNGAVGGLNACSIRTELLLREVDGFPLEHMQQRLRKLQYLHVGSLCLLAADCVCLHPRVPSTLGACLVQTLWGTPARLNKLVGKACLKT